MVPWRDVMSAWVLFQPVGKVDMSKSPSEGEESGPGGPMSFCNVSGSDEVGEHGSWDEKSGGGGKDLAVMEMVQT
jgi:hypothetical protein